MDRNKIEDTLRHVVVIVILIFIPIIFLISCQKNTKDKNSVVIALENSPSNLDPRKGTDLASARIHEVLFNTLVTPDEKSQLVPELCQDWKIVNGRDYIFRLKKGVKFHNGQELTAKDVEFTFNSLLEDSFISAKKGSFREVKSIEVLDDYTVKFTLHEPRSSFLINIAAIGILPYGISTDVRKNPIGTGPFKFIKYKEDQELIVESFDNYFEGKPKLNRLIFKIIPDAFTRMLELRKGSIDLAINNIPEDMVSSLAQEPHLQFITKNGSNYSYIGINIQDLILKHRKVRQAIAHAINRESIIKHLLNGFATPAKGILPQGNWTYEDNVVTYEYNPELSQNLLDQAAFIDPDGVGPKSRFTLTCKISNNKRSRDIAIVIQENLRQVGIDLHIKSLEWQTYYQDIMKSNFQLCIMKWIGAIDPDIYRYVFYSKSIPPEGANRGHYIDKEIDEFIIKAKTTLDQEELKALYSQIQKKVAFDVPYISLWHSTNIAIMQRKIKELKLYPTASFKALKNIRISS
jgi:peptide/nickel transport system substrate-binding protein